MPKQGNYTVKEELGKARSDEEPSGDRNRAEGRQEDLRRHPLVSEGADAYGLPAGFYMRGNDQGFRYERGKRRCRD